MADFSPQLLLLAVLVTMGKPNVHSIVQPGG